MGHDERRRILLVEDDAIIAMAERSVLERNGFDVLVAHTGERAVEHVDADRYIDMVLMDIDLGDGISGVDAARRILSTRKLPVVFVTSHAEQDFVDTVKQITRYGYVLKSSGEFVLIEAIQTAFELFASHRRLERSERKYRMMVETAPMAFQSLNEEGRIADVNNAWIETLGYTREDAIGRWFGELLHPDEVDLFRDRFPVFKERGHIEGVRFHLRAASGDFICVEYNGRVAYTEEGRFSHTVCIFQRVHDESREVESGSLACARGMGA